MDMFGWLRKEKQDVAEGGPKGLIVAFSSARNGQCEKALARFRQCDIHTRAAIVQEAAYLPVTEGVAKLMAYALHHEPDTYVKSVARRVTDARIPLRMQALQYASNPNL